MTALDVPITRRDRVRRPAQVAEADAPLRDVLIEGHMALARSLARRFGHRGERLEDLEQVALLALVTAADRFDPERGVKFSTFATATIVGSLKRHFRDRRWGLHVNRTAQEQYLAVRDTTDDLTARLGRPPTVAEIADAVGLAPEQVVGARETEAALRVSSLEAGVDMHRPIQVGVEDPGFGNFESSADVARALAALPERDQCIIRLRFLCGLTQAEIGQRLGMSQMTVSRLLSRSLTLVRQQLYT